MTTTPIDEAVARVEAGLEALDLPDEPAGLYAPIRYVLEGGGKRVRPVLVLLAAEAFGGGDARRRALRPALGVEVFHNFTLVHDDIMDRSDTRRGRPTVHVSWDEPTAILAGDLMMGLAASLITQAEGGDASRLAAAHFRTVAALCEGQARDVAFETRSDVTVEAYLQMVDGKTGALLEHALEVGALVGGAGDDAVEALRRAGRALGRAFQLQDDLLDLTADPEAWGKPIGGDLVNGKRTALVLWAAERAAPADREWLAAVFDGGLDASRVPEARERLGALGVLDAAAEAVAGYTAEGLEALGALPPGAAADALRALAGRLARRTL